jgi:hypothetical protein
MVSLSRVVRQATAPVGKIAPDYAPLNETLCYTRHTLTYTPRLNVPQMGQTPGGFCTEA